MFPIDCYRCNNNFNTMTRFLLKLLVAYLYVTNAIGETYRDEECPECEYEDVKPIQVSKQTGYSSPSKKTKSHKSKSATPKQTDSLPTMQEDSQNVDDDAVLWDAYVLELHKKHDKGKPCLYFKLPNMMTMLMVLIVCFYVFKTGRNLKVQRCLKIPSRLRNQIIMISPTTMPTIFPMTTPSHGIYTYLERNRKKKTRVSLITCFIIITPWILPLLSGKTDLSYF